MVSYIGLILDWFESYLGITCNNPLLRYYLQQAINYNFTYN